MKPPAEESWWQLSWIRVGSLQNGSTLSGKKRSRTGVRRLYFPHLSRCEMWRNLFNIIPLNSRLLRPWWGNSAWQANCSAQFVVIKKKGGRAWIHALTTLFHPFFSEITGRGLWNPAGAHSRSTSFGHSGMVASLRSPVNKYKLLIFLCFDGRLPGTLSTSFCKIFFQERIWTNKGRQIMWLSGAQDAMPSKISIWPMRIT